MRCKRFEFLPPPGPADPTVCGEQTRDGTADLTINVELCLLHSSRVAKPRVAVEVEFQKSYVSGESAIKGIYSDSELVPLPSFDLSSLRAHTLTLSVILCIRCDLYAILRIYGALEAVRPRTRLPTQHSSESKLHLPTVYTARSVTHTPRRPTPSEGGQV